MIIGFLGKGGSGKSTMSTRFARFLAESGRDVLAIDADHNMDLAYNLGAKENFPYFGGGLEDIFSYCGLLPDDHYSSLFLSNDRLPSFSLSPADPFTARYTEKVKPNIRLMAAGPHTENVLYGQSCSHILYTPLKIYLPLLNLASNEAVVVDEKAGRDSAGTGITTGFDSAIICAEPTVHSVKAANQIAELCDFFETPYEFVLNKSADTESAAAAMLLKRPEFSFEFSTDLSDPLSPLTGKEIAEFEKMREFGIRSAEKNARLEKTRRKFQKNSEFANQSSFKI